MSTISHNQLEVAIHAIWWYAHGNYRHWKQLDSQLAVLKRSGLMNVWHQRGVQPGLCYPDEVQKHWQEADLILPLVSPDLLDLLYTSPNDACVKAMEQAWERHRLEEVYILPIYVQPCDYSHSPFGHLHPSPGPDEPVVSRRPQSHACAQVAKDVRQVVETLLSKKWKRIGDAYRQQGLYDQALRAYNQALSFNQQHPALGTTRDAIRGQLEAKLVTDEQYIAKIEQGIRLHPYFSSSHKIRGDVYMTRSAALAALERFEEAIATSQEAIGAYDRAIQLSPDFKQAYRGKGQALEAKGQQEWEQYHRLAQQEYRQAEQIEHDGREHRGDRNVEQ